MIASSDDIERENRELARRSERLGGAMRELEHFSFGIAHDLWAPLRAINDIARGVEDDAGRVDAQTVAKVRSILSHGAAMEGMIENLLDFCRYASLALELETVDMEALVREAWSGIAGREGVTLTLEKLPPARGHRAMLKLVWSSLLANAVRYGSRSASPSVEVTGGESPGHVIYGVRDNGAGFDLGYSGKLAHVFLRLATGTEYPGTGVALAIVQRIVTRHRGNVWIDARAGEGAFFQFSLPLHDAES
jgi:light-regulated signal transduction histidine kinase (bacteriophytochrome)